MRILTNVLPRFVSDFKTVAVGPTIGKIPLAVGLLPGAVAVGDAMRSGRSKSTVIIVNKLTIC